MHENWTRKSKLTLFDDALTWSVLSWASDHVFEKGTSLLDLIPSNSIVPLLNFCLKNKINPTIQRPLLILISEMKSRFVKGESNIYVDFSYKHV